MPVLGASGSKSREGGSGGVKGGGSGGQKNYGPTSFPGTAASSKAQTFQYSAANTSFARAQAAAAFRSGQSFISGGSYVGRLANKYLGNLQTGRSTPTTMSLLGPFGSLPSLQLTTRETAQEERDQLQVDRWLDDFRMGIFRGFQRRALPPEYGPQIFGPKDRPLDPRRGGRPGPAF
jgi:hypothetical protein